MDLPILDQINQLIVEHGSAVVAKEHVSLLKTKLALLAENIENLQTENSKLIKQNAELQERLLRHEQKENFEEYCGALIKYIPGTGYSNTPCCPHCKTTLYTIDGNAMPYTCSRCGHISNLRDKELNNFLKSHPG